MFPLRCATGQMRSTTRPLSAVKSLSRACNIPNLISHIYIAFLPFHRLKRFTVCVSACLRNCMRTKQTFAQCKILLERDPMTCYPFYSNLLRSRSLLSIPPPGQITFIIFFSLSLSLSKDGLYQKAKRLTSDTGRKTGHCHHRPQTPTAWLDRSETNCCGLSRSSCWDNVS